MGNEHTTMMKMAGGVKIPDEAVKAEAGFPNIYTPTQRYVKLVSGEKSLTPKERREEINNFLLNSPEISRTKRLVSNIKLFIAGGFIAVAYDSFATMIGRIQYFPFHKVEVFTGERRRLSLYPLK